MARMLRNHTLTFGPCRWIPVLLLAALAALLPAPPAVAAAAFTGDFRLESCTWSAQGRQNPYFNLRPGFQLILEGEDDGEEVHLEITVTNRLETITFRTARGVQVTLAARLVEERESKDGELVEVSRNWFARCVETSDVFYFGEEVDFYENGAVVGHGGSWRAGENGAQPGIIMPGSFLLGARYFQEGVAVPLPAGILGDCVTVEETTPIEPAARGRKTYCPRVGLVKDGVLELVGFGVVP